jgi:tRNA (guanine-N7-)-methyltransferase
MARGKLARFAENTTSPNVIEEGKPIFEQIKGHWHSDFFHNSNPIVLELACGRGEYTVGLAAHFPEKNFIGVDIKGDRIWKGSQFALQNQLHNAAFLRTQIQDLERFFAKGEVSEIWLVFPDPRPKKRDIHRRISHPRFLEIYRNISCPNVLIRLKTDNPGLFDYTMEVLEELHIQPIAATRDLYNSPLLEEHLGIRTKYEKVFSEKGFTINYVKFCLE